MKTVPLFSGVATLLLVGILAHSYALSDSAPAAEVSILGNYNAESGWYYGKPPIATFSVTDEFTDIDDIVVLYKGFDKRCKKGVCMLDSGESMKLNTNDKSGKITFRYFSLDNEGKSGVKRDLTILSDPEPPEIYILQINTPNVKKISTGNICKHVKKMNNCETLNVMVKEIMKFDLLGSDRISGLEDVYYRVVSKPSSTVQWQPVKHAVGSAHTLYVHFDSAGYHIVQFKGIDIAGNESALKEYLVDVR